MTRCRSFSCDRRLKRNNGAREMHRIIVPLFIVMALCLSACGSDSTNAETAKPENEGEGRVVEQIGKEAAPRSSETFVADAASRRSSLTGFTRARNSMTLVSEEAGRVEKVVADVGDTLGPDGLFAQLDTTFIRLDLAGNRADQQRLRSDLEYNKKEMDRYKTLVKNRNAAQSTLDSNVRSHQSALQQLKAKEIQERVLSERLERFSLRGPSGWKVVTRYIEPGEWITTGTKVAELGRYDVLLVPFALTSGEYRALKEQGGTIELTLTDLGKTIRASVARVSPGFDAQTRKINVDLEIAEGDFEFRGGLRTELVLDLPDPGGAVIVPRSALIKAYEEYFLMTPDRERVRVVLLGSGPGGTRRVSGSEVRAGDTFLLEP